MEEIKLVVFDMAGTTVLDTGQVPAAFSDAMAEHSIQITPEQLKQVRGSSKQEAVLQLVPNGPDHKQRAETVYRTFRQRLSSRFHEEGIRPVEGAEQVFEWLKKRNIRVALNTGFDRDITNLLLTALRWQNGVADAIVCVDDVPQGRPAPYLIFRCMEKTRTHSVHHVANVGDTLVDLQAARNAGTRWNIGVLSGAHDRKTLEQTQHTHLLPSIADLPTLWAD